MKANDARPFNFRLALLLPLALMAALLVFDPAEIDLALARHFYEPGVGFIGRHSYLLENILHDRAKQAVILLAALVFASLLFSLSSRNLHHWRRPLACLLLSMALSTSIVTPLKVLTAVHCPWSLAEFGGKETFTPLLEKRAPSEKPGRCWPAGHASTGFSLIALFFFLRDPYPKAARIALAAALALGTIFSLGRMMQGAHFLSHCLWTLLFDWLICLLCYRALLYRRPAEEVEKRIQEQT